MKADITETLIQHFTLADVLAFAVAREDVRDIDAQPANGTAPTMRCQSSIAYLYTRRLAA